MEKATAIMDALTTRELDTLGKRIHEDGKFGADYAPMSKNEKKAFIAGEAVRLFGTYAEALLDEHVKSILQGRIDSDAGAGEIEEASDCAAPATGTEKPSDGATPQSVEGAPSGGFGFDGPPSKTTPPACDENCSYHQGQECPNFPAKGACETCGIKFINAKHHNKVKDDAGNWQDCPNEQALSDFHQPGQGEGDGAGEGGEFDLDKFVRRVCHEEVDPIFAEVAQAFGNAEATVHKISEFALEAYKSADAALTLAKEARKRRAQIAGPELKIEFPNIPAFKIEGHHPIMFPKVMALLALADFLRPNIFLYGAAGAGKTTIAKQLAEATLRVFSGQSGRPDMTSSTFNGRVLPIGEGRYIPSDLVRLCEAGLPFLYLFDEYTVSPPEIQLGLNTFLAQKEMWIEERSFSNLPIRVVLPPGAVCIAADNTDGLGPTPMYPTRNELDGSTRDRWLCLKMEEDPAIVAGIYGASYTALDTWVPMERSEAELRQALLDAYNWHVKLARSVAQKRIPKLVTPRMAWHGRALLTAGFSWEETKQILLAGWKDDELAMTGQEVYS